MSSTAVRRAVMRTGSTRLFAKADGWYDVILVLPLCSQRYNLGLAVELEGLRD